MITRVMTWTAQPGRGLELVAVLKEVAALSAKINGVAPPVVATTVGGAIGEVSLIAQAESVDAASARVAKNMENSEMVALVAKLTTLVADGGFDQIYQHA